jgi:oxalate---CoA ligase
MIPALLSTAAAASPNAPAILAPGRASMSYGLLQHHVSTVASQLHAFGIRRSDRVAIVLPHGPEMAVAFLAVATAAVAVPLNPALPAPEFESLFSRLRTTAVLLLQGDGAPRTAARQCGVRVFEVIVDECAAAGAFQLRDSQTTGLSHESPKEDDLAVILTTSGTTARPKIIPLTHRNICSGAANIATALELSAADSCLNVMPLFHCAGLAVVVLASISAGASVVYTPGFDERSFLGWLDEFKPTWYAAVPTMQTAILGQISTGLVRRPGKSLRFIRSGSAALSDALRARLEEAFEVPVVEGYSTSETQLIAATPLQRERRKTGAVGVPRGIDVAIMDPHGRLLPPGVVGEIVCRGPSVMAGYEDDPAANVRAFTAGWFRTGDQGSLDADGYLSLAGRLKEEINRGGQKVSPQEVDDVLLKHPAVAQAASYGVPEAVLGEDVAAAVVVRPGVAVTAAELRQFVAAHLAAFKVPRQIKIVPALPEGPTGKVLRRELAEMLGFNAAAALGSRRSERVGPRTEVESHLVRVWEDVFGIAPIGVTDDFFDLGGDSLLAASMMTSIEELLGYRIAESVLFEAPTIEALARIVTREPSRNPTLLKVLQPGDRSTPFIMVDGDMYGSGALYCVTLSRHLGSEQPFYTLSSHGTDGGSVPPTIAEMARDHVRTLFAVLPHGPYVLGGYSHGGLVAFEMARQLTAAGHQVLHVVIVDIRAAESADANSAIGADVKGTTPQSSLAWLRNTAHLVKARCRKHLGTVRRMLLTGQRRQDEAIRRRAQAWRYAQRAAIFRVVKEYVPGRYLGAVTVIISHDGSARRSMADPTLGWRWVAPNVRTVVMPGDHQTCVSNYTSTLARHIGSCLAADIRSQTAAP